MDFNTENCLAFGLAIAMLPAVCFYLLLKGIK